MATTAEHHPHNAAREAEQNLEQLFEAHLQAAGLENVPSKVREWIKGNAVAYGEVVRLADKGFGDTVRTSPAGQAALIEAFVEAAVLDKLRQSDSAEAAPVEVERVIEDMLPAVEVPAAAPDTPATIALPADMLAHTIQKSHETEPVRTARTETATDTSEKKDKRTRNWKSLGKKALAGVAIVGAAAGMFGGLAKAFDDPEKAPQGVELAFATHETEVGQELFNGKDPFELYELKTDINNFGPPSQAGFEGDHQGMLDDWESLYRGKIAGSRILIDAAANMQYATKAQIRIDGLTLPTFPGVDALHDPAVYDRYHHEVETASNYLRQHPEAAWQLHDIVMKTLADAKVGDLQKTPDTVASNYIDHNSTQLYWDLSVAERNQNAQFRPIDIEYNGQTGTLNFLPGCGQWMYVNAAPLQTTRPAPAIVTPQPVHEVPPVPHQMIPVTPQQETPPPAQPPVEQPPIPQPPVDTPILPKTGDFRPDPDGTTDSGIGIKPPVEADPIPDAAPPVVEQEAAVEPPVVNRLPNLGNLSPRISVFDKPAGESPIKAPKKAPPKSSVETQGPTGDETNGGTANEGNPGGF